MASFLTVCARPGCARPIRVFPGQPRFCGLCKEQFELPKRPQGGVQASLDEGLRKAEGGAAAF